MEGNFCGLPAWGKAFDGEELLLLFLDLEIFFVDQDPVYRCCESRKQQGIPYNP